MTLKLKARVLHVAGEGVMVRASVLIPAQSGVTTSDVLIGMTVGNGELREGPCSVVIEQPDDPDAVRFAEAERIVRAVAPARELSDAEKAFMAS